MSEQVREQPAPGTPFARLIGVIVSPGETFKDISRNPGWIAPFVTYMVVFLACFSIYAWKADWVGIVTDQIEGNALLKLAPEEARDKVVADATENLRKLSRGQLVLTNVINVGSGTLGFGHFCVLFWAWLFAMMGSLKDLRIGRAWGRFLLCLLTFIAFLGVSWVANFTFKESPGSALLLTGTAAVIMVGAWGWLLNANARDDVELHRMLSVLAYSTAILMVGAVALAVVSLVHQGDIQVTGDKLVPSNLAVILKPDNAVVRALFGAIDIFTLWFLGALTMGFRTVTRLSTAAAAAITFLPWGLIQMIKVAWAAAFG